MDEATKVAKDLLEAVKKLQEKEAHNPGRHTQALHTLAKIFRGETEHLPKAAPHSPQTSTNPTKQEEIRHTPRVHQRVTRNNTPGIIPTPPAPMPLTSEGGQVPTTEGEMEEG